METNIEYKIKCLKGKYLGQVIPVRVGIEDIEDDGLGMTLIRLGLFSEIAWASSNYFEVLERSVTNA